jgi:hypothetical protein
MSTITQTVAVSDGCITIDTGLRSLQWSHRPLQVVCGPEQRPVPYTIEAGPGTSTVIRVAGEGIEAPLVFRFPMPDSLWPYNRDWQCWAAGRDYPTELFDIVEKHAVYYEGADGGITMPMLVFFNKPRDIGLTFARPFGCFVPDLRFVMRMGRAEKDRTLEVIYDSFAPGSLPEFTLQLHGHRGDYRCGLGALFAAYPAYFQPNNPRIKERWFFFSQSGVENENPIATIEPLAKQISGDTFSEFHHFFPSYGDYFPLDREEWMNVRLSEGRPAKARQITKAKMAQHLDALQAKGIGGLLYIQFSGDMWEQIADERFPDALPTDVEGKRFPAWTGCILGNGSLRYSFGRHLREQFEAMLAFGGDKIGGFFQDMPGYAFFDFSHDDGISLKEGKPAFRMSEVYDEHKAYALPALLEKDLYLMGNGPWTVEIGRGMDALMAEGCGWMMGLTAPMTLDRPLIAFYYTTDPLKIEAVYLDCLKWGAYPGVPAGMLEENTYRLITRYEPFFALLAGRRWVFDPHPLELPESWEGNVFSLPDGRYVAFAYKSQAIGGNDLRMKLRLADIADYEVERVFTLDGADVPFTQEQIAFSRRMTVEDSLTVIFDGDTVREIREEYLQVDLAPSSYVYAVVLTRK